MHGELSLDQRALALPALAQTWPARPVTMVVPFAAGSVPGTTTAPAGTTRWNG